MPNDETLYAIDDDDAAFLFELSSSAIGSQDSFYSSEGGVGFYTTDPAETGDTAYTIGNTSRMYGLISRPALLLTYHPNGADLKSFQGKVQEADGVTVIYCKHSTYNDEEANRVTVAIKIDGADVEVVGYVQDVTTPLYITALDEGAETDTEEGQLLIQSFVAGSRFNFTAQLDVVASENIDGYIEAEYVPDVNSIVLNDFFSVAQDKTNYWILEGQTALNALVDLPMQNFSVTMWSYRATQPFAPNYLEVMIPSASNFAAQINDCPYFRLKVSYNIDGTNTRNTFIYFSGYQPAQGDFIPLTKQFTYGTFQDFCLIKSPFGYAYDIDGYQSQYRELKGIRSDATLDRGRRVICNFDPVLKPGMIVNVGDESGWEAKTITYFVSASDQYMEVYNYHV